MAVSRAALIPRVRSYLDERPYVTTASAASSSSVVAVTDGTDWDEGAIVEFQDDGEQALVRSISSNDLTCFRGWNGTTAASHSSGAAWRDPVFTYKNIDQALTAAISRLWPYCWKTTADTITPLTDGTQWYDLAADAFGLVNVVQQYGASSQALGTFGDGKTNKQVIFERNLPTGLVTSGVGLKFPDGFFHVSNTVRINYATAITGTSDIEDDGDLNVAEAVIYGALARLLAGKEAERVGVGEDLEQTRSIRVGGRISAGAYYERMFRKELETLRYRHKLQIPIMPTKRFK